MPFRDLLLQLDSFPSATPPSAIDAAVQFAGVLGAKATALAVRVDIPLRSNVLADRLVGLSALEREWEAHSRDACAAALAHFETAARAAGVFGGSLSETIDLYDVDQAVARHARARDLCLVPFAERYDGQVELAQSVIFQSGRPVLAFPAGRPLLPKGELSDVVVAWDGSRAAARALADALPLLDRAAKVRAVTFVGEKPGAEHGVGGEVVRHLAAHGVTATAHDVQVAGERIGGALDRFLEAEGPDLLVMGAYGHSRLRETVLGGATAHMLKTLQVPVLFSH